MGVRLSDLPDSVRVAASEEYARQLAQEARRLDAAAFAHLPDSPAWTPDPEAVTRGRANSRKGRDFEASVDSAVDGMRLAGIASLHWNNERWRIVRERVPGQKQPRIVAATPIEKGAADLLGVVRGGRAVIVELKTCSDPRMNVRQHVTPGEREALDGYVAMDGLAFLLVCFDRDDPLRWHRYEWREVRERTAVEADEGSVVDTLFLADVAEAVHA